MNITDSPQPVTLRLDGRRGGWSADAQRVRLWPGPATIEGAADGEHKVEVPPRGVLIWAVTEEPSDVLARVRPLLDENTFELVGVDGMNRNWRTFPVEGVMRPVRGPGRALWACDDAVMDNAPDADGMTGSFLALHATAMLDPARGAYYVARTSLYRVSGREPHDGHGRPMDAGRQPFLLARRLPHLLESESPLRVWSGSPSHLLAEAAGGTRLQFARPGLIAVTCAKTGNPIRGVDDPLADSLELPGEPSDRWMVGYAAPDPMPSGPAGFYGDIALWERVRPWVAGWAELPALPSNARLAALAKLSRDFPVLMESLGDRVELLEPASPLLIRGEQMQALLVATVGSAPRLHVRHGWLTPGQDKDFTVARLFAALASAPPPRIVPVGTWRSGSLRVTPLRQAEDGTATGTVRLNDGRYVERILPLLAVQPVERDGLLFEATHWIYLEPNRPVEFFAPLDPLSLLSGETGTLAVLFRNWSQDDVTLRLVGHEAVDGLRVTPEPEILRLPALSDVQASFRVTVSADAPTGQAIY
ncbi:MAG: hypothetical protein U1E27_13495, partial [Kiritimatiellia bacterium]|nr:hypothetical protein [Kiritimatiellia bacterium]